jgi:protein-tyrosine phosphatase
MGYVDLHSHVLPALDDGAPDDATSRLMLAGLASIGYDTVTATPHQKANQFLPEKTRIDEAYARTRPVAEELKLRLALAAENFWDDVFFGRVPDASYPRYDGGRAFLFEIPTEDLPVRFEEFLFQFSVKGMLPVMAHPERYRPFQDSPARLERISQNVPLVVDLGAVAGHHGARPAKLARHLLAERIAHAAASDVHAPSDVPVAAEGIAWIKKKLGAAAERRLLDENPRRILAGELPDP